MYPTLGPAARPLSVRSRLSALVWLKGGGLWRSRSGSGPGADGSLGGDRGESLSARCRLTCRRPSRATESKSFHR